MNQSMVNASAGVATTVLRSAWRSAGERQSRLARTGDSTRCASVARRPAGSAPGKKFSGCASVCAMRSRSTMRSAIGRSASVAGSAAASAAMASIERPIRLLGTTSAVTVARPSTRSSGRSRRTRRRAVRRSRALPGSAISLSAISAPNICSAASRRIRLGPPRKLVGPRARSVSTTTSRAVSMASRTARRCSRAWTSQRAASRSPADNTACMSAARAASRWYTSATARRAGRNGWRRQMTSVRTMAHSAPPTKPAASAPAVARSGNGRSSARISAKESSAPSTPAAWPWTRTKDSANSPNAPSGSATGRPRPRARPTPAVTDAPSAAKLSRTGRRRRIGPPGSHRQVHRAASAASFSAAQCRRSLSAMITATDSAARRPSARLMARRFRPIGRRARSRARSRRLGETASGLRATGRVTDEKTRIGPLSSPLRGTGCHARGAYAASADGARTNAQSARAMSPRNASEVRPKALTTKATCRVTT